MKRLLPFLLTLSVPAVALASGDAGDHGGGMTLDAILHGEHGTELAVAAVNFVLLVIVLRKILGNPLSAHLEDRRREVEEGMKEAAEMKAKADAVYKEYSERLESLEDEMKKLRSDIEKAAEDEKQRILEDARAEATRLKSETEALVDRHANALGDSIKRELVEAAVTAAEESLRKALTGDDQRKLADHFVSELHASDGSQPRGAA